MTDENPQNALWGGRFKDGPHAIMTAINASIDIDRRLWRQDIHASRAHAAMLAAAGIISASDAGLIAQGLGEIAAQIEQGQFTFSTELEDIHLNIEQRLTDKIGEAGKRLHTARSRNDQVATDFRLWLRDAIDAHDAAFAAFQRALLAQAGRHVHTVMPGFTHLQSAQPIVLAHHLLAYVEMAGRDRQRFAAARDRLNECPLGAAALAGTPYPIDRTKTATTLGFDRPMRNSLDAVSSRDFALDYLSAAAIAAMHLSRMAEEIVLWVSPGFRFAQLSDRYSTGSSIMPQKRNPDAAELVRAKAARIAGQLQTLLGIMQSLPLAYAKDMQEDKPAVFDAHDALELCLAAMTGMAEDLIFNPAAMRAAAGAGYATATDLADWLVKDLKLPFREAHHVAGAIVRMAEAAGKPLEDLDLAEMQAVDGRIHDGVFTVLGLDNSVMSRNSFGGTAPERVLEQIAFWQERLK